MWVNPSTLRTVKASNLRESSATVRPAGTGPVQSRALGPPRNRFVTNRRATTRRSEADRHHQLDVPAAVGRRMLADDVKYDRVGAALRSTVGVQQTLRRTFGQRAYETGDCLPRGRGRRRDRLGPVAVTRHPLRPRRSSQLLHASIASLASSSVTSPASRTPTRSFRGASVAAMTPPPAGGAKARTAALTRRGSPAVLGHLTASDRCASGRRSRPTRPCPGQR